MDRRDSGARLLLEGRLNKNRLSRARRVRRAVRSPPQNGNRAPAVRATKQVLRIFEPLVTRVKVVRHVCAEREVVAELTALSKEVVVVECGSDSDTAAASLDAIQVITVS